VLFVAVVSILLAIAPSLALHIAEWHFAAITNSNVAFVSVTLTDLAFCTSQTHASKAQMIAIIILWVASITETYSHFDAIRHPTPRIFGIRNFARRAP
jgi:uncharacterized membrane protein